MGSGLRKLAVGLLLLVALGSAYLFWFRDSSLVQVDRVEVTGLDESVHDAAAIREALVRTGRQMSTLNLKPERLRQAVSGYPEVKSVRAETGFPDSLTIEVTVRRPVARIGEGTEAIGVAADGVLLPGAGEAALDLPALPLAEAPERGRVRGPVLDQVRVIAAAPPELLPLVEGTRRGEGGLIAVVGPGIELRFGEATRLEEKWRAAVAVLTDPSLERLDYVDLSSPARPAVGGDGFALPAQS